MLLKTWDDLPDNMKNNEVRPFFDLLKKNRTL